MLKTGRCSTAPKIFVSVFAMALSGLLKDLDIAAVPHGFRSSLRDWAAEETNHSRVYDRYDYDAEKWA